MKDHNLNILIPLYSTGRNRARSTDWCKEDTTDSFLNSSFKFYIPVHIYVYIRAYIHIFTCTYIKEATSDSAEVIIKPDLMGHHMWRGVLLGLRIYT